jgi:unsaturated rhamnogalacturonyl hydrolase
VGREPGIARPRDFEPAVRKAWPALVGCVNDDGRLTHVQPAGSAPVKFSADATSPYGGGVFLLAGSEVYRMAVLGKIKRQINFYIQSYKSILNFAVKLKPLKSIFLGLWSFYSCNTEFPIFIFTLSSQGCVMDGVSSRILDSQALFRIRFANSAQDKLLFQVDLAPGETRNFTFWTLPLCRRAAAHRENLRALCAGTLRRFRVGKRPHRAPRLRPRAHQGREHHQQRPDVWIKTYRNLMVNEMYASGHYHMDNGDEMDDFRVGHSAAAAASASGTAKNFSRRAIITIGNSSRPARSARNLN